MYWISLAPVGTHGKFSSSLYFFRFLFIKLDVLPQIKSMTMWHEVPNLKRKSPSKFLVGKKLNWGYMFVFMRFF